MRRSAPVAVSRSTVHPACSLGPGWLAPTAILRAITRSALSPWLSGHARSAETSSMSGHLSCPLRVVGALAPTDVEVFCAGVRWLVSGTTTGVVVVDSHRRVTCRFGLIPVTRSMRRWGRRARIASLSTASSWPSPLGGPSQTTRRSTTSTATALTTASRTCNSARASTAGERSTSAWTADPTTSARRISRRRSWHTQWAT